MMNSNNPKVQQNTPRVQINTQYVPDSGCVQNQTLQAHVPAESINPKRLMGTSGIPKSFEAVLRHNT